MEKAQGSGIDKLSDNSLESIADLCTRQIQLENSIQQLEDEISLKKEKLRKISYELIPEALAERNLSELKLSDGSSVTVKKVYGASITKGKEGEALQWLRENDFEDLIKNDVTVSFGRGEDNKAGDFRGLAEAQGFMPSQRMAVHPSTLRAFYRERVEAGQDLPPDIFNTFSGQQTKIKR
jgi:hypothetical protein